MTPPIPPELVENIARGDAVLFVGAGLSRGAGLPTWIELLAPLADSLSLPAERRTNLLQVAQDYEIEKGRHALQQHIADQTDTTGKPPTANHRRLVELPIQTWATTNYDDLLEQALADAGLRRRKVVRDQDLPYTSSDQVTVLKLHGDREQPDTIVITREDYDTFSRRFPQIKTKLGSLLLDKTFLFIGYSVDDPDFNQLRAEIAFDLEQHQRRAYAVLFDADDYSVKDLRRRQIEPLNLTVSAEQDSSQVLGEFLDELIRQVRANTAAQPVIARFQPSPAASQALHAYLERAMARYERRMAQALRQPSSLTEPYRGLLPFRLEDRSIFFGRDAAIAALYSAVFKDRLTVVQARSGAGKTSLLNAGLAPRLIAEDRLPVYARPYEDPVLAIKRALASPAEEPWPELLASLPLPEFLGLACSHLSRQTREVVLILDQFEELFVFWPQREARQPFVGALAECYHDRGLPLRIVLAIRKDYFGDLQEMRGPLPGVFQNLYHLDPMTRQEAAAAITGPVQALGQPVHYEPALLDALLDDLARGGMELPHLQIICSRLYQELPVGKTAITLQSYQALGEARGILGRYLQDVLERLPGNGAQVARQLLKELVSSESTRWVRSERELAAAMHDDQASLTEILDALVRDRVLQREEADDEARYQLAHEYLIQEVGQWLDQEDLAVKGAYELLQRQLDSWRRYTHLIPPEALRVINEHRDGLRQLRSDMEELILRSSLAAGVEVDYWRRRAPAVVGKVEEELFGALAVQDPDQGREAVDSLAALASTEIVEQLAALVDGAFNDKELTWIDHEGTSHAVRHTVLNLHTLSQRRAMLVLAKMILPEATEALERWTPHGMVLIPAGPFTMGSTEYSDEGPVHEVWLDAFWIDRYPVTNAQWAAFLGADPKPWRRRDLWTDAGWEWREGSKPEPEVCPEGRKKRDHPVRGICWYESLAYARWAGKLLLSEAQWEKAARGTDGRRFPWDDEFDEAKCNTDEGGKGDTTPVGAYSSAGGDSPYSVADMAGNVWEWCRNLYVPYRYNASDGREVLEGTGTRVLRGGSFYYYERSARCVNRGNNDPYKRGVDYGLRVGASPGLSTTGLRPSGTP